MYKKEIWGYINKYSMKNTAWWLLEHLLNGFENREMAQLDLFFKWSFCLLPRKWWGIWVSNIEEKDLLWDCFSLRKTSSLDWESGSENELKNIQGSDLDFVVDNGSNEEGEGARHHP
jgi:hypothetical protein